MSEESKRLKAIDVKGKKSIYRSYRLIPYPEIEEIMKKGGEAFVESIDRRTAYSAAKTLSKRLGFPVKQEKRIILLGETDRKGEFAGIEGYIFTKKGGK